MVLEEFVKAADEIFHTYDIRTERKYLDSDVFLRLCDAEAEYLWSFVGAKDIVLCRDTREGSSGYLQAAYERFSEHGFNVFVSLNPVSTCRFYYSVVTRKGSAGIMITASHNPREYTGEKIVGQSCEPIASGVGPVGGLDKIREIFINGPKQPSKEKGGKITVIDDCNSYIDFTYHYAGITEKKPRKIRIIADFMSGSAGDEIMRAFESIGAKVIPINAVPDGNFPSGTPNPIVGENIRSTLKKAEGRKGEFDFLFIFDGDGDRIIIYDNNLIAISPSIIVTYLAKRISLLTGDKKIGLDSKAVPPAREELERKGYEPILIPNGHSLIKNMLKKGNISFAAEETGHYYINLNYDGLACPYESTLLIAVLFSFEWEANREYLEELISIQKSVFSEPEWSYFFDTDEKRDEAFERVHDEFIADGFDTTDKLYDGSSLGATLFEKRAKNEWCILAMRISRSEKGLIRVMLRSSSEKMIEYYKSLVENTIRRCLNA